MFSIFCGQILRQPVELELQIYAGVNFYMNHRPPPPVALVAVAKHRENQDFGKHNNYFKMTIKQSRISTKASQPVSQRTNRSNILQLMLHRRTTRTNTTTKENKLPNCLLTTYIHTHTHIEPPTNIGTTENTCNCRIIKLQQQNCNSSKQPTILQTAAATTTQKLRFFPPFSHCGQIAQQTTHL